MHRFIINLDRSPHRWENVKDQIERFCLSVERIPAVDGKILSNNDIHAVSYPPYNPYYYIQLTPGEIGCFQSHRKCWQKLVDSDENWALIMEDDFFVYDEAIKFIKDEKWIPKGVNFIKLTSSISGKIKIRKNPLFLENGYQLIEQLDPEPISTIAYLISREAAKFACQITEKQFIAPVDVFFYNLNLPFARQFKIWQLSPFIFTHGNETQSDIGYRESFGRVPFFKRHTFNLKEEFKKIKTKWAIKTGITHILKSSK